MNANLNPISFVQTSRVEDGFIPIFNARPDQVQNLNEVFVLKEKKHCFVGNTIITVQEIKDNVVKIAATNIINGQLVKVMEFETTRGSNEYCALYEALTTACLEIKNEEERVLTELEALYDISEKELVLS